MCKLDVGVCKYLVFMFHTSQRRPLSSHTTLKTHSLAARSRSVIPLSPLRAAEPAQFCTILEGSRRSHAHVPLVKKNSVLARFADISFPGIPKTISRTIKVWFWHVKRMKEQRDKNAVLTVVLRMFTENITVCLVPETPKITAVLRW